ncbi:MlaC/ttg2D family ABC transporter substrate-binding protein [Spiribacter vilamensis]|uniref:Phospholipid transport system substrate-binding protein n=1 Tax=Spiribacter vilamensis TaxID=531306 RepID=A0A4Q8D1H3_9GAMM|nr:ABC transporter substrate-binding protein [Spiribacter vilamensis]RZU99152.1 phospholipid transport system substrate-binding protein [Spiribacter vilamensis]
MTRTDNLLPTLQALVAAALLMLGTTVGATTSAEDNTPETPEAVVEYVVTDALNSIAERQETLAADRDAAVAIFNDQVRPYVDTLLMARFAMGPAARTADPADIERLAEALADRVANLYAGALQRYAEDAADFAESGSVDLRLVSEKDNRAIVSALAEGPGIDSLKLRIQLYKRDDRWRVFDIETSGISILLVFRDALQSAAGRDGGVDAMIEALEEGAIDVEDEWEEQTGGDEAQ